jgi:Holliday junction resolvase
VGQGERRKGQGGEREVAELFRAAGFDTDRTPNSGALRIKGDLHGNLPLPVEVKRQEVARPWLWAEQAAIEAGANGRWLVAMRRSRSPWLAMMPLDQAVRLLAIERLVLDAFSMLGESDAVAILERVALER